MSPNLMPRRRGSGEGHVHGGEGLAVPVHVPYTDQARHVVPVHLRDVLKKIRNKMSSVIPETL